MSRIRGSDTSPELRLRRRLWAEGLRYRLNVKTPGGRPDLVFPGPKVAVFVDGCFWHGCPEHYVRPRSSEEFWAKKLKENLARDRRQTRKLEEAGWAVLRFWEHEIFISLPEVVVDVKAAVEGRRSLAAPSPRWHVAEVTPIARPGDHEPRTLQALRDPSIARMVEQPRSTDKW